MLVSVSQAKGQEPVEVTDELFEELTGGANTPYLMMGAPAVRIYPEGKRAEIERLEGRSINEVLESPK